MSSRRLKASFRTGGQLLIAATLAAFALWVHLREFSMPLRWDSQVFVVIGKYFQRGLLPYRDLWDIKPPGIFFYLAGVFSVLPAALWSVRVADFLLYLGAAAAYYRLCRKEAWPPLALMGTGAWLYFGHHPTWNVGGVYTEEYVAIFAVCAVAAAEAWAAAGRWTFVVCSGMAAGTAFLFKQPGAVVVGPAVILVLSRRRASAVLLFIASWLLPVAAVVAFFWYRGGLNALLDNYSMSAGFYSRSLPTWNMVSGWVALFARELQRFLQNFRQLPPLLVGSVVVGLPVCVLRPNRLRVAAAVWVLLDAAAVAAQANYFPHYFIQLFPSTLLVGVIGAAWLLQARPSERWHFSAARFAVAAAVLASAWPMLRSTYAQYQPTVRRAWEVLWSGPRAWPHNPAGPFEEEIGTYIRKHTQPDDRMHLEGWGARTVAVYWSADRLPAIPEFYAIQLFGHYRDRGAAIRATQPTYIEIADYGPLHFLSPWLAAHYSLETIKRADYRAELWVRNHAREFRDGTAEGLSPHGGDGLVLKQESVSESALSAVEPTHLTTARRGRWTSPVVGVRSDDGTVVLDWHPRQDLAANRSGFAYPRFETSYSVREADVTVLAGVPTLPDHWTTWPKTDPVSLTVDLGVSAVTDRVVLTHLQPREHQSDGPGPSVELQGRSGGWPGEDRQAAFTPITGTWDKTESEWIYRFAPRLVSAVRLVITPLRADEGLTLQRLHIPALGMGVTLRYRTGPDPHLDDAPWLPVEDTEPPPRVHADRYVQVQCEVWSEYDQVTPILRYVQIGRERFEATR